MPAGDSQQARERTDKLDRCGSQQATASRRETVSVLLRVLVLVLVRVSVLVLVLVFVLVRNTLGAAQQEVLHCDGTLDLSKKQ